MTWPRRVGDHLIERDIHPDPKSGDAAEFRCAECGERFAEFDEAAIRRRECSTTAIDRGDDTNPPDEPGRDL